MSLDHQKKMSLGHQDFCPLAINTNVSWPPGKNATWSLEQMSVGQLSVQVISLLCAGNQKSNINRRDKSKVGNLNDFRMKCIFCFEGHHCIHRNILNVCSMIASCPYGFACAQRLDISLQRALFTLIWTDPG